MAFGFNDLKSKVGLSYPYLTPSYQTNYQRVTFPVFPLRAATVKYEKTFEPLEGEALVESQMAEVGPFSQSSTNSTGYRVSATLD